MISVIIPTRNRADMLAAALDSLQSQTIPVSDFEVVVVDNGSTDGTRAVVQNRKDGGINIKYCYEPLPGLHAGRHHGLSNSIGDILTFADDDIEAQPTWLEGVRDAFTDQEVVMVGGNNIPEFLGSPPEWLLAMWKRRHVWQLIDSWRGYRMISPLSVIEFFGKARPISPYLVWGCNFSIRKPTLIAAGGFHPDGMPPELLHFRGDGETYVSRYVQSQGLKCVYEPRASVKHKVTKDRMTLEYFAKRGYAQGISHSYSQLREWAAENENVVDQSAGAKPWRETVKNLIELTMGRDVARALSGMRKGKYEGINFHRQAYNSNPEVRSWVHKANYY